jgi:hypothetical protein
MTSFESQSIRGFEAGIDVAAQRRRSRASRQRERRRDRASTTALLDGRLIRRRRFGKRRAGAGRQLDTLRGARRKAEDRADAHTNSHAARARHPGYRASIRLFASWIFF